MPLSLHEPVRIFAGDTVEWGRDLYSFPAGEWSLHYSLTPELGGTTLQFTAAQDTEVQTRHIVTLLPAVTGAWKPGTYRISGWVANTSGQRFALPDCSTWCEVLPDPSSTTAADTRTAEAQMVSKIETAIGAIVERRAAATTINGQTYTLQSLDALQRLLEYYRRLVEAAGPNNGFRPVEVRF